MPQKAGFVKATKGKVILALFLACFALFIAWSISKVVFQEMLQTVDDVSAPSSRLNLVNSISRKISSLDQQQKKQAYQTPGNYNKLFSESSQLRKSLDSLVSLYPGDSVQAARIKTIKTLLIERDKQFMDYLRVRASLVNNQSFSSQVKELNALVSKVSSGDSTVLASEEQTSTTTFAPENQKPRSFFGKLFGKKREDNNPSFTVISERKIKLDTISLSQEDLISKSVETSLKNIEAQQRKRNNSFVNRETQLANANGILISQMLEVLTKVENEVVNQIESNATRARSVVNSGITRITLVMIVFFLITIVLLWLILTDITRSNKYRHDLEVAKDEAIYHGQAKQRFLANMSHEIRTPLQSILGYSELLVNDGEYNRAHIKAISQSSEHLLQIVNEVLDYNRIISGKFVFTNHPFSMQELLNEIVSMMRPQALSKSLTLDVNFDLAGIDLVIGDEFRLRQILLNLVGNAIKFTKRGKVILAVEHKVKLDKAHFTFTVEDTGVGMSEADTKIVFNEFEQSKRSQQLARNEEGAGLGLTIVKALVDNQHGRIYLKSRPGKGTVFTVFLVFDIVKKSSQEKYDELLVVRRPKGTIWIVDDDPLILNLCELIFNSYHLTYRSFKSSIDVLSAPIPDDLLYILMDMRMPEMNGTALCQRLRQIISPDIQIIAMTAQVLPSEQGEILKTGFNKLLMKPFKAVDLLNAVTDAIEIDLESLRKMTMNDPQLMEKIIKGFCEDCNDDRKVLLDATLKDDWETVMLVVHRLAGRLAQIGVSSLAASFRTLELTLLAGGALETETIDTLQGLLKDLHAVASRLEKDWAANYSIA
jgi:signal transduction histidine kinase/FixJ family two-component response regulator